MPGTVAGPTSKADCLNRLWDRMLDDEQSEGRRFKAVLLHDAEDLVDPDELRVVDSLIERFDLVQLPVAPLIRRDSRWISGTYADEFAEAHGKEMVVRAMLGAGLPSAGVGCGFSREALGELAAARGRPFDTDSLTEDYELGLRFKEAGRTASFVRLRGADGHLIATREYFPGKLEEAVRQKTRWMTGIALAGWDRLGWNGGFVERWMRLRDRQSVIAALFLAAGYFAIFSWGALKLVADLTGREIRPFSDLFILLALLATFVLLWRLVFRFGFVAHHYGPGEALRSPFRAVIGNAITIVSARRAIGKYLAGRRSGRMSWEKTAHDFPTDVPAE